MCVGQCCVWASVKVFAVAVVLARVVCEDA